MTPSSSNPNPCYASECCNCEDTVLQLYKQILHAVNQCRQHHEWVFPLGSTFLRYLITKWYSEHHNRNRKTLACKNACESPTSWLLFIIHQLTRPCATPIVSPAPPANFQCVIESPYHMSCCVTPPSTTIPNTHPVQPSKPYIYMYAIGLSPHLWSM